MLHKKVFHSQMVKGAKSEENLYFTVHKKYLMSSVGQDLEEL